MVFATNVFCQGPQSLWHNFPHAVGARKQPQMPRKQTGLAVFQYLQKQAPGQIGPAGCCLQTWAENDRHQIIWASL